MVAKNESTDSELIFVDVVALCFPFFVFSVLLPSIHTALLSLSHFKWMEILCINIKL